MKSELFVIIKTNIENIQMVFPKLKVGNYFLLLQKHAEFIPIINNNELPTYNSYYAIRFAVDKSNLFYDGEPFLTGVYEKEVDGETPIFDSLTDFLKSTIGNTFAVQQELDPIFADFINDYHNIKS